MKITLTGVQFKNIDHKLNTVTKTLRDKKGIVVVNGVTHNYDGVCTIIAEHNQKYGYMYVKSGGVWLDPIKIKL